MAVDRRRGVIFQVYCVIPFPCSGKSFQVLLGEDTSEFVVLLGN